LGENSRNKLLKHTHQELASLPQRLFERPSSYPDRDTPLL